MLDLVPDLLRSVRVYFDFAGAHTLDATHASYHLLLAEPEVFRSLWDWSCYIHLDPRCNSLSVDVGPTKWSNTWRLTSSNLNGTTVQELHQLEQQLNDGLISVKEKKDAMDVHKTLRPFVLTSAVEKGFERAMLAVSQRWPVLLHGRVGASKTALISRGIVEGLMHLDANQKCHGNLNARHVLIKPGGSWYLRPTPILCSLRTRGKDGKAIDMQALAKLILHCLTYHKQYDNLPIRNEDAVFHHKWADLKNENGVAYDLIGLLLQNLDGLDYSEVYLHPFFLTWDQRLDFLRDMSDYLLRLQKEYPNCSFLTTIKSLPVGSSWMSLIDNDWKKDMIKGPMYLVLYNLGLYE
ncbi:midasin isoform X2 [Tanacetum coccineum]